MENKKAMKSEEDARLRSETSNSNKQSRELCERDTTTRQVRRYGDAKEFLLTFNPSEQLRYCLCPDRCVGGGAPSLKDVCEMYDRRTAVAWLMAQLHELSQFCGSREKMNAQQQEQVALMVVGSYPGLKVTELMLFFYRMKQGLYGRFYGSVDPMTVLSALRSFVGERNAILERLQREEDERRREESRKNVITYEEYKRMHGIREGNLDRFMARFAKKSRR